MLRSTRPLISSSARVIPSSQRVASIGTLRRLPFSSSTAPNGNISSARRGLSPLGSLLQKTSYATKSPSGFQQGIDPEEEKKFREQKLEPHPAEVSSESSVRHTFESGQGEPGPDMSSDIKDELNTVKDTFRLSTVPKESYVLGLAGTIPYLATSVSTVYLSWNLNTPWPSSSGLANSIMMSHESAQQWLSLLEPIQLGYGAIIISFLGAIHWGLEYAEKTVDPGRTRFRYAMGVMAPVVAWPTFLMPIEFALTTQFAAFVGLYFADVRASIRGWAPSWYGTYRFVLTAMVGVALVISLIGRAKVGDAKPRLSGLNEKIVTHTEGEQPYTEKWAKLEAEDKAKMQKEKEEAEKKKKEEEKKEAQKEKKQGGKKGDEQEGGEQKEDGDTEKKGEEEKTEGEEPKTDAKEEKEGGEEKKEDNEDKKEGSEEKSEGGEEKKEGGEKEKSD